MKVSVHFIEKIDEFFEIDLVVGFDAGYLNHRVHFLVCYALVQEFEHLFQILCTYISFSVIQKFSVNNYTPLQN